MDSRKLTECLQATIQPNEQRQQAEDQLRQIQKIIGFAPSLLQVIMSTDISTPVRQAGVVYLKNFITQAWHAREPDEDEPIPFSIHEQDRAMVREAIVDAVVLAPEIIRVQLCVCLKQIIKYDFPTRWTQIVDKINIYLTNPDTNNWLGALVAMYQLMKNYEYQSAEKRAPLIEAMNLLLPLMYNLIFTLVQDQSEHAVLIQKQILKNFFSLTKSVLPLQLLTKQIFAQWMEVFRQIADKPVPDHTLQVDEDERQDLPWWKCKKWALHILYRIFERYGSPVNVREEYVEFAEWYLTTFTGGILEVLLKMLDQYRNKIYVTPRVLHHNLNYINNCVSHAHSWKLLKPHMFAIIQDVLFPLMSYSESDEELWKTDPHEYIRIKFDMFEDYVSPVTAGQVLLTSCCKKRKEMLQRTIQLCMQVLTSQNNQYGPRQRDGALHMVGTLSEILLKKKMYKDQIESLLAQYVFPEFANSLGYIRARACWVLHNFASVRFKSEPVLVEAVRLTINALMNDKDLPVKVEASIALKMLLSSQEKVHKYLEPQVSTVTLELLKIVRETENDDVADVLQKIVPLYTEQLMPIAVDICEHLATTFNMILETDGTEEKAITAMGLLGTIETVLSVMEDNPEIMAQLERSVLRVADHILRQSVIEYYEEAMSLLCNLTCKNVSENMWKILELLYQKFDEDGFDYFTDMMPVLHNYVTVDTDAFLSNENHVIAIFTMCKRVLQHPEADEESEIHAAKLLEVMVLQCKGKIDNCLHTFVELILNRLTRKVKTSELRTMLLQVLIAILYCNPHLLLTIIEKLQESVPNASITDNFIKQWIHDIDCFVGLHDRKLCVLGLCTLLEMGNTRPNIAEIVPKILPSCLILFEGLKHAYEATAAAGEEGSSSEEDDDDEEAEDVLSSDEDEIDEMNNEYLENLARQAVKNTHQNINITAKIEEVQDDSEDDSDYDNDETAVECYTTPLDDKDCQIDEYIVFKNTLLSLSTSEPPLYHALMSVLNEDQQKALQEVFVLADQRKAQQESKRIEKSGGYSFTLPTSVPTTFKFGTQ